MIGINISHVTKICQKFWRSKKNAPRQGYLPRKYAICVRNMTRRHGRTVYIGNWEYGRTKDNIKVEPTLFLSINIIKFATTVDLNKRLKQIKSPISFYTCAPISVLPYKLSTIISLSMKKIQKKIYI